MEGQAFQSKGNGSVTWSGLQIVVVQRRSEIKRNIEPSTEHGVETVRFCAFAPPGSPVHTTHVLIFVMRMEGQAFQSKGNGSVTWSGLQIVVVQ
jgi:hypothetical protein